MDSLKGGEIPRSDRGNFNQPADAKTMVNSEQTIVADKTQ